MRAILLCRQNHNQSTTDLTKVAAQAEKPCNGHAKPKQTAESEECPSFVELDCRNYRQSPQNEWHPPGCCITRDPNHGTNYDPHGCSPGDPLTNFFNYWAMR
jgi:hypothetical protein